MKKITDKWLIGGIVGVLFVLFCLLIEFIITSVSNPLSYVIAQLTSLITFIVFIPKIILISMFKDIFGVNNEFFFKQEFYKLTPPLTLWGQTIIYGILFVIYFLIGSIVGKLFDKRS